LRLANTRSLSEFVRVDLLGDRAHDRLEATFDRVAPSRMASGRAELREIRVSGMLYE
jgi:hypothetical protein